MYGYKSFKKFYKTLKVTAIFLAGIRTSQTFNILRVREHQPKTFVTLSGFWLLKESPTESVKQGKFDENLFSQCWMKFYKVVKMISADVKQQQTKELVAVSFI